MRAVAEIVTGILRGSRGLFAQVDFKATLGLL